MRDMARQDEQVMRSYLACIIQWLIHDTTKHQASHGRATDKIDRSKLKNLSRYQRAGSANQISPCTFHCRVSPEHAIGYSTYSVAVTSGRRIIPN